MTCKFLLFRQCVPAAIFTSEKYSCRTSEKVYIFEINIAFHLPTITNAPLPSPAADGETHLTAPSRCFAAGGEARPDLLIYPLPSPAADGEARPGPVPHGEAAALEANTPARGL